VQLVAIGFLLAGDAGDAVAVMVTGWSAPLVTLIGLTLLWVSALVTLYTGYDYFRAGVHHLIED
jgi:cardiolipin synthase